MDDRRRKQILEEVIQWAAETGWYVTNRSDFQATIVRDRSAGRRLVPDSLFGVGGIIGVLFGRRQHRSLVTVQKDGTVDKRLI